jgi:hypothetical protein
MVITVRNDCEQFETKIRKERWLDKMSLENYQRRAQTRLESEKGMRCGMNCNYHISELINNKCVEIVFITLLVKIACDFVIEFEKCFCSVLDWIKRPQNAFSDS